MLILLSQVLQRVTSIFANLKFLRNAFIPQSNSLEEKKRSNNRQGPYYSLNTESQSRPQGVLSPPQKSQISRVAKKRTKRCLTSLIVRELQIKTTMRFSLTPVIMIIQKKNQKIYKKWWRRCGEKGTLLYCWWECKLVKSLLRTSFSSIQSLSHVRLFVTPWIAALQASLSITSSRSSLKLTSISSSVIPFSSCPVRMATVKKDKKK